MQPGGHRDRGSSHRDRRFDAEPGDGRLHLRQGAPLRRSRGGRATGCCTPRCAWAPRGAARLPGSAGTRRSNLLATRLAEARERFGGESILPFSYGGSNGLLTQDTHGRTPVPSPRRVAARAHRLRGARPARPRRRCTGRCRRSPTRTTVQAQLIVVWGANPSTSGIHLVPSDPAGAEGGRPARGRRSARDAARAPGRPPPARQAGHRPRGRPRPAPAPLRRRPRGPRRSSPRTPAAPTACGSGPAEWTFERAASVAGVQPGLVREFAELYVSRRPALIRCGWGLERNRNGGSAAAAVLALPAVAGKFGVRGGGYTMSNSAAWSIDRAAGSAADDPPTREINMNQLGRALDRAERSARQGAVRLQLQPGGDDARSERRVLKGLEREDLFTVVFDQVMTDTAAYADLVLPATTFLEHYDLARGYGPISLQMVRPVVDSAGEARSNAEVFGQLSTALNLDGEEGPQGELETLLRVMDGLPGGIGETLRAGGRPEPPFGLAPVQFVDVFPRTRGREGGPLPRVARAGIDGRPVSLHPRRGGSQVSAGADLTGERPHDQLDARRAAAPGGGAGDRTRSTRTPAAARGGVAGAGVQRSRRGATAR